MRLVRRIVLVLAIAIVLLITFVLVPPHVQIRDVEPALPAEADLLALLDVEGGPVRVEFIETSNQDALGRLLGHNVFLITWPDGRRFMIDASMDEAGAADFAALLSIISGGAEHTYLGSVADTLGEDVQQVMGVGYTHLHIDHTQGTKVFCAVRGEGARVYQTVHQREEQNVHTEEGAAIVSESCLARGELEGGPLLTTADFPGFGMASLGGHTPGSTLFAAAVDGHLWVFSGDITNSKSDLLDDRDKGFAYSYLMVPEHTDRTEMLRAWLRELDGRPEVTVAVSHDVEDLRASAMPRYASGAVASSR